MAAPALDVINPYTEKVAFTVPLLREKEVEALVQRARSASSQWRHVPFPERKELCERFLEVLEARGEEVAAEITVQMGKPIVQARKEIIELLARTRHIMEMAQHTLQDEYLREMPGFIRYIRHEPLGVVLDIAAWNYPLLSAANIVIPALLAGNAVILKHSSKTPLSGRVFSRVFLQAGAPEGLVQDVAATHELTQKLIEHSGVDYVWFTGAVRGGHEVNRAAANRFIEVGLELSGKDAAYVCADAPLDFTVAELVRGAFSNAGQSSSAVERIYVDAPVYDTFVEAFAEAVRTLQMGNPLEETTSLGPLASPKAPELLREQVREALEKGGRLTVAPVEFDKGAHGWFAGAAVVAEAPQECALMQEESFGPIVGIRPVANESEAVRRMNDSRYGLTASVWTSDAERAMRLGELLETGTVYMNRCDFMDPALPWSGVKNTGRGAVLSHYGILRLTRPKSMHLHTALPAEAGEGVAH